MIDLAAICWAIWLTRNAISFERKKCRSPIEIICLAASFMAYWAGLQNPGDKMVLESGAEAMKNTALFFPPAGSPSRGCRDGFASVALRKDAGCLRFLQF